MKPKSITRVSVSLLAVLVTVSLASAQTTYTWENSNVTGTPTTNLDWFTGGPNSQGTWIGGDPVSNNLNTIQIFENTTTALPNTANPSSQTINLNNGGNAFELGTLTLSGRGSATTNANLTMNLAGDALNFSAATGTINLHALNNTRTITYNVANNIQLGTLSSGSALTLTGNGTSAFNFSGIISELLAGGGSLVKSGTSSVTLTGGNTYTGTTTINGGTLNVRGTVGSINLSSGVTVGNGATLGLDNNLGIVDRISDSATLTLNGGNLIFTGRGSNGSATETINTLAIGAGGSTLTLTGAGTGQLQTLAASSFSRTGSGTALIRGTSLQTSAANSTRLALSSSTGITLVGGGTANLGTSTAGTNTTLSIAPYLMGDTSATGAGSSFLTYDESGALRPLAAGEYTTLSAGYTTPGTPENVNAFNGTITTASDVTVNSLRFNGTQALNGSGGALIVNSGAIALTTNNAASIGSGFSGLTLGNGTWNEGIIHVSQNTLTINTSTTVTGGGGLTKAGAGTLAITGTLNLTGGIVVNQGTLSLANTQSFTGGITMNGGALTVAGTLDSLGAAGSTITVNANSSLSLNGNTTLNKSFVLNNNSILSMANGSGSTTTITGPVTGTGGLQLASRQYNFQSTSNTFSGAVSITANTVGGEFIFGSLYDGLGAGNLITNSGSGTNVFALGTTAVAPYSLNYRQFVHANDQRALVIRNDNTNRNNTFTINTDLVISGVANNRTLQLGGVNTGINRFTTNLTDWSGGTLALTKADAGTWALSGTNSYSGDTNLAASGGSTLIFQGSQSLSPNTKLIFAQSSSAVASVRFLDDGVTPGIINFNRPIEFGGNNTSQVLNIFVGNNNTANGGSSSGTTTDRTIQVGDITHTSLAGDTGTWTLNATSANGYRLQTGTITLNNLVSRTAAQTTNYVLNPTSANMTVAAITMATGNITAADGIPVIRLAGTSSDNIVTGVISNATDFATGHALSLEKQGTSTWTLQGPTLTPEPPPSPTAFCVSPETPVQPPAT